MNGRHGKLIAIDFTFMVIVVVVNQLMQINLGWFDLLVLGLATNRLARSLSFNEVFEWLRHPFCEVKQDSCGAGANVHPKNGSLIGALLSCPICTGTWSALILLSLYKFLPVLVYALAVASISEILHWGNCWIEWQGRLARVQAGQISPDEV